MFSFYKSDIQRLLQDVFWIIIRSWAWTRNITSNSKIDYLRVIMKSFALISKTYAIKTMVLRLMGYWHVMLWNFSYTKIVLYSICAWSYLYIKIFQYKYYTLIYVVWLINVLKSINSRIKRGSHFLIFHH